MTFLAITKILQHRITLVMSLLILVISISACGAAPRADAEALAMAPLSMLPEEMQTAPVSVREAYQFALANPEVLSQIPCYCGCGPMGHTSNYSCYLQEDQGGEPVFDSHALGCGICVDITQDAMRMLADGDTVVEIRAAVDAKYAQYGPSNMP